MTTSTVMQPSDDEFERIIKGHPGFKCPDYEWGIDDFEVGKKLGSGQFGQVFFVREKVTKVPFALKCIRKERIIEMGGQKQILREIEIHSHLNHKNIITLYKFFHDEKRLYMLLEMAFKGEIYRHLQDSPTGYFPDKLAAKYIDQVCDALIYIHSKNVIHRDIKPENLLLDSKGNVKLADFGWSVHTMSNRRATMCGTLDYLPPEIVRNQSYDPNVDLWCIGILCYEFLVGKPPFENSNHSRTQRMILNCQVTYPDRMDNDAKHLISKLLVINPKSRLNLIGVKNHIWIQKYTSVGKKQNSSENDDSSSMTSDED